MEPVSACTKSIRFLRCLSRFIKRFLLCADWLLAGLLLTIITCLRFVNNNV